MARSSARLVYSDFSTGEMSPTALARVDLEATFKGCKRLRNFTIRQIGGAQRRLGTVYVNEVKDSSKKVRLFHLDTVGGNHVILELGDLYCRFYTEDGGIYETSPGVPTELVTPWTEDQLDGIQTSQFEDLLVLTHADVHPQVLQQTSSTTFSIGDFDHVWGPFLDVNIDTAWTMSVVNLSVPLGTVTITASEATFEADHVSTQFYLSDGTTSGYVLITTFTSDVEVNALIIEDIPARAFVTSLWAEAAWSSIYGYPKTSAFFQQRSWFAGVRDKPQLVWGSVIADYTNFALGADDDAGIAYRIASLRREEIVWLFPAGHELYLGTEHSVMELDGGDAAVTPSNVRVSPVSAISCHGAHPVYVDNRLVFLNRSRTSALMLSYDNLSGEQHNVEDLNLFTSHIGAQGFKEITFSQVPFSTLSAVTFTGKFVTCTLYPATGMVAWAQHDVGGGFMESIHSAHVNGFDTVWMIAKRTVEGNTVRYIEKIGQSISGSVRVEYVDCGLYYAGVATDTITGLDHLEGETVTILSDGASHPPRVVSGGEITLEAAATSVAVGLEEESILEPVALDTQESPLGAAAGLPRGYGDVYIRLVNSALPLVNGLQPPVRDPSILMGDVPPLVTEDIVTNIEGFEPDLSPIISVTLPLRVEVAGIFAATEFGVR